MIVISPQTTFKPKNKLRRFKGFTLIELLVVLAILAAIAALGLPRIGSRNNEVRAAVRKLTVLGKELQTHSRLQNKTYRIAFEMNQDEPHRYWVESAAGHIIVNTALQREYDEADEDEREEMGPKLASFSPDPKFGKEPFELPNPLRFKDIEVGTAEDIIDEGRAYIHFFPQGMVEESAIHITDGEDLEWTVAYNPLTGKGHIISSYVTLEDLRGK